MILLGNCIDTLPTLPAASVQTCVTSPPYFGLRDYGVEGQLGLEPTPREFVDAMVRVFREVRRVLRDDGTLWLNIGDSYTSGGRTHERDPDAKNVAVGTGAKRAALPDGLKPKDLIGIPWRVAFALQADGWYLRQDIIWAKPNPMPESVRDRCTKAHEYLFLMSKSERYYFDAAAIAEPSTSDHPSGNLKHKYADQYEVEKAETQQHRTKAGLLALTGIEWKTRNKRSVWTIPTQPTREAHFATFPEALVEPCIRAGSRTGDTVLDPFLGSGTTALVAEREGRQWIGCELNPDYAAIAERRLRGVQKPLVLQGAT